MTQQDQLTDRNRQAAQEDRQLVDRCLSGESAAWDRMYRKHHPILLSVIRSLLSARSTDDNLAEEIAARVWYALVRDHGRRLDRYDGRRGYRLSTFLAAFAKREMLQHFRSEQRRRLREQAAPSSSVVSSIPARAPGMVLEEFLSRLTPRERQFFEANLVSQPDGAAAGNFSVTNAWQLKHRVQRKFKDFLNEQ